MWADNVGHSALIGVCMLADEGSLPCALFSNFTIYRTFDFGMYTNSAASTKVMYYLSIDNQV